MHVVKRTSFAALLAVAVSGCATVSRMPLQEKAAAPDLNQKSVMVARLKVRNEYKPGHQPKLSFVVAKDSKKPEPETFSFTEPTLLSEADEAGRDYFFSMEMAPGPINILGVHFSRQIPLLLSASAVAELNAELDVPPNTILYLGSIDAVIIERTNDSQPRAGAVIPLIDQAVAGFSGGTFRLDVKDDYENDQKELFARYPFLKGKEIQKRILTVKPPPPAAAPAPAPASAAPVS